MAFAFDEYLTADDISIFAHVHMWLGNFFEHDCFGTTGPSAATHPLKAATILTSALCLRSRGPGSSHHVRSATPQRCTRTACPRERRGS